MDAWAKACQKDDPLYAEWWQQGYGGMMAEGVEKTALMVPTSAAFRAGFAAGVKWAREDEERWGGRTDEG